jgi:CRISPR-associated protein Cas1
VTGTGAPIGYFACSPKGVQRRIRQYQALSDDAVAIPLARELLLAKMENELRHLLRASRKEDGLRERIAPRLEEIRAALRGAAKASDRDELMGFEGVAAKAYFAGLAELVDHGVGPAMRPEGRSRRPPEDRFNALLSFGYGMLYRDVLSAILRVGLDPAFGFLHQPRSSAFPLVLDLMELFRTPVVDLAVLGAVNRRTFDAAADFSLTGKQVWLSDAGRKKLIEVHERRKYEEYRHGVLGYSLSFARHMELEVRLLEKEWSGERGMFARMRIR